MRVLICGDRNWTDRKLIETMVANLLDKHGEIIVIDGGAKGADSIGSMVALELGLRSIRFPANWNKYGLKAGPIRNKQMLDEGKPDLVLAFHDDLANSKGTKHMVSIAEKAGIEVIKVKH